MQSIYGFLADLIVIIHFLYVAYVVVGQLAIFAGVLLKWQWIRNPWFRWTHLVMICIVAVESIFDFRCPLTDWQVDLEKLAGRQGSARPFVAQLFENLLFCNVDVDHWAFKVGYISFAVLVIACLWLAPPRRRNPAIHISQI
jgi:uncharacterized protein DUF2784